MSQMEKEGFGEEFSIYPPFLFWGNWGRTTLIQYITTWNITQWNTIISIYDKGNFF